MPRTQSVQWMTFKDWKCRNEEWIIFLANNLNNKLQSSSMFNGLIMELNTNKQTKKPFDIHHCMQGNLSLKSNIIKEELVLSLKNDIRILKG